MIGRGLQLHNLFGDMATKCIVMLCKARNGPVCQKQFVPDAQRGRPADGSGHHFLCFMSHTAVREFGYRVSFALILQIIWVMVPMGQKLHQVLGFHRVFTTRPMMVEVSMRL